jgi:hypothetical protein
MNMAIWCANNDILAACRDTAYCALLLAFSTRATRAQLSIHLHREILRLHFPEDGPATHQRSGSFSTRLEISLLPVTKHVRRTNRCQCHFALQPLHILFHICMLSCQDGVFNERAVMAVLLMMSEACRTRARVQELVTFRATILMRLM